MPSTVLSIIIVSYNTEQLTIQTITSAVAACYHNESLIPVEIIVIDNNSTDNSVQAITNFAKTSTVPITCIANKHNKGFSAANNQGIKKAKGKYLLLLNSDTIVSTSALSLMLAAFQAYPDNESTLDLSSRRHTLDRLGILAASLYNPDGNPQPQGGSFPSLASLFFQMSMLDDLPVIGQLFPSTQHTGKRATNSATHIHLGDSPHLHQKDWVAGTAMMIRREVLDEIGLLDSNIFMYGEDVEFCLRAKQHHWDIAEHVNAAITHFGSASAGSERAIIGELTGYLYIWSKHMPTWQYPIAKAIIAFGCHLRRLLFGTMLQQPSKADIYTKALAAINQV